MKTLNNFRLDNNFEEITIGQVTICAPDIAVYKLTLPIDTGLAGQVLTTDGNGVTSWTTSAGGSVTSVDYTTTATGFVASGGPITESGTLNLSYSGAAIPTLNGGTGVSGAPTGTVGVVLKSSPTISNLTTTGTTNMATLALTNALPVASGGTGVAGTSTGTVGVVLKTAPTISDLTTTGTTNMATLALTNALPVTSGGTGVTTVTGSTNLVLSNNPSLISPTLTTPIIKGTSFNTILSTQATSDWTLSLPVDDGDSGQVLTTNGSGLTSWSVGTGGSVTSVGIAVPDFLTIASSPITSSGVMTIGLNSGLSNALPVVNGGTGVITKTGTGSLVLDTSPEIEAPLLNNPVLEGSGVNTITLIHAAETDWTLKLPSTGGTADSFLMSDGFGNTVWMALGASLDIETVLMPNKLILSVGLQASIALSASRSAANTTDIITQTTITNPALALATSNLAADTTLALAVKLSTVGISVPAFLTAGSAVTTIDGTGGTLDLLLSGTALPVTSGGTGVLTSTGIGDTVLSNGPSIDAAFLKDCAIEGSVFDTILTTAATSDWTLTLPVDGGSNNEVLTTNGSGTTTWSAVGTVTSVAASVPAFLSISGSPITASGTLDIGLSGTALPTANGGTGSTSASTGTGGVVLSENPYIRGDGVETFVAQFQDDFAVSEDTSIAITAGEDDEATLFFGTTNNNDPNKAHKVAIISKGQNTWGRADLHFCLNDDANDSTSAAIATSRMMIEREGNVGIGNVAPSQKLDVTGTIQATNMTLTNPLPVSSGGTGTTAVTGTGSNVLATAPTFTGEVNFANLAKILVPGGGEKDVLYLGESGSIRKTAIFSWEGNTDSTNNYLRIGFFGITENYKFGVDGVLTLDELKVETLLDMNDKPVYLRSNDTNHGLVFNGGVDGPNLFGNVKGILSTGGNPRMYWGTNGISTNDSDYFQYTTGTWTPGIDGVAGGDVTWNIQAGRWKRIGNIVSFAIEVDVSVSSTGGGSDSTIWFTGFPFSSGNANWQRVSIGMGIVPTLTAPFWFEIQQSSSLMYPKYGNDLNVKLDFSGDGDFNFVTNGTFLI